MIQLAEAAVNGTINPEAVINAAIAAKSAELAATQAFYISIVVIVLLLAIGAMMMFVAYKFDELKRNTDGMREALIIATRKVALMEGHAAGRADLIEEQAGSKEMK